MKYFLRKVTVFAICLMAITPSSFAEETRRDRFLVLPYGAVAIFSQGSSNIILVDYEGKKHSPKIEGAIRDVRNVGDGAFAISIAPFGEKILDPYGQEVTASFKYPGKALLGDSNHNVNEVKIYSRFNENTLRTYRYVSWSGDVSGTFSDYRSLVGHAGTAATGPGYDRETVGGVMYNDPSDDLAVTGAAVVAGNILAIPTLSGKMHIVKAGSGDDSFTKISTLNSVTRLVGFLNGNAAAKYEDCTLKIYNLIDGTQKDLKLPKAPEKSAWGRIDQRHFVLCGTDILFRAGRGGQVFALINPDSSGDDQLIAFAEEEIPGWVYGSTTNPTAFFMTPSGSIVERPVLRIPEPVLIFGK